MLNKSRMDHWKRGGPRAQGGQAGVSSEAVGSEEVKWLSLPAPLPEYPALALSESPLSGSPALDATQNQQLVRPSAGLPSPALRQGKTQGTPGARWVQCSQSPCSCVLPSTLATVSRVPKGCLISDLSFLQQTFHEHLACTKPSAYSYRDYAVRAEFKTHLCCSAV